MRVFGSRCWYPFHVVALMALVGIGCGSEIAGDSNSEPDTATPSPIQSADAVSAGKPDPEDGAEDTASDTAAPEDAGLQDVGPEDSTTEDAATEDAATEDAATEDAATEDAATEDAATEDAGSSGDGEEPEDVPAALLPPGEPCEANDECEHGACVVGPEGFACAWPCGDAPCSEGWWCAASATEAICVWVEGGFCGPCASSDACGEGACVPSASGNTCALPCSPTSACPTGFTCAETAPNDAPALPRCVPAGGDCACALVALESPSLEPCSVENEWGACSGVMVCTTGGDMTCGAPPPAPESCNGLDDDCNGVADDANAAGCTVWYADEDGDGAGGAATAACLCAAHPPFTAAVASDCDDGDASVGPKATESCNGKDDDCDGVTDPPGAAGCTTWWLDADGDGYGAVGSGRCLCGPSGAYAASETGDCNDGDADVHPEATEECNGVDDDCDGEVDPPGSEGCEMWHLDTDGDGYGVEGQASCACKAATPYTADQAGDCDDAQSAVHPGAEEVCSGVDDDCDGLVDPAGAPGCTVYFEDLDSDGFGAESSCQCTPAEPFTVSKGGDCDDGDPSIHPGATTSCGQGACTKVVSNCVNGIVQECVPPPAPPGTCNAPSAACKTTTTGVDACGQPCTKVGPAMCYTVHPACTTSSPGTATNSPLCLTPTGKYDCGLTACPGGLPGCGVAACDNWPNTLGADCTYCQLVSCKTENGKDRAQFSCANLPAAPTP